MLLGLPLILDGGVLFLGLVLIPAHFDSQFLTLLTDSPPDVGFLVVAAIAIAVTSAVTRIVLVVRDRKDGKKPGDNTIGDGAGRGAGSQVIVT